MRTFLTIIALLIISGCGNSSSNKSNDHIFISYEKNEFVCNSCLLLNLESQLLQIIFDQQNEFHDCSGSYNYRLIGAGSMSEPKTTGDTNEYQLEYIDSKDLSDCLTTVLDFSIEKVGSNNFEVYLNNDKYRLTK